VWKTMKKKCISQYELLRRGIDNRTLDTLRKNGNMTLYTLEKICKALDCNPEEVVEFTDDDNSSERE
jgi:putative transcriptional regulator